MMSGLNGNLSEATQNAKKGQPVLADPLILLERETRFENGPIKPYLINISYT